MEKKPVREEPELPEAQEAAGLPAGEKLDDQDLSGAAGGYFYDPRNPRDEQA